MGSGTSDFRFGGTSISLSMSRSPPILNSAEPDPSSLLRVVLAKPVAPISLFVRQSTASEKVLHSVCHTGEIFFRTQEASLAAPYRLLALYLR
ncbi:MAG: hypothetical protein JWM11_1137 [Planctomycetaceae bacterium]|nr:hypothetical protein [Planctomycetaceae bacterium]